MLKFLQKFAKFPKIAQKRQKPLKKQCEKKISTAVKN